MEMNNPNYYAIIPATVRYDKRLLDKSKLLYGEITALCNKEGFCWAGNEYFADLYDVNERTVRRLISNLKDCGYIDIQIDQKNQNPRKIFLLDLRTKLSDLRTKLSAPQDKIVRTSIYSINNTINTAGKAVYFLLKNYEIRFEQEFLMEYEKKFKTQELFTRFLNDFNDEAEMKGMPYGAWLIPMLKKYARNWIDSKNRFSVIRNNEPGLDRPDLKRIG